MTAEKHEIDWLGPWKGLTHCQNCHGLMGGMTCPVCKRELMFDEVLVPDADGTLRPIKSNVSQGALSWTAHSLLRLMQREWDRKTADDLSLVEPLGKKCSDHALVVILFWTLFEHLMEQFFQSALSNVPPGVRNELMRRFQSIGSRLDRLYKIVFGVTFASDMERLGYARVIPLLSQIQNKRNDFIHGNAEAIDDALAELTVKSLFDVQSAWLALYNLRCTGDPTVTKVWEDRRHRELVASWKKS